MEGVRFVRGGSVLVALLLQLLIAAANAHIIFNDVQFSYAGASGPDNWGSLSPAFATCSNGKQQSPIDIKKEDLNTVNQCLTRDYQDVNSTLFNNGFNVGVLMEENAGAMVLNNKNYTLKSLHWHTPAEHTFNGFRHPAELHLVHLSDDGELSIVAIIFKIGDPDPFVAQLMDELKKLDDEVCSGDEEAQIPAGVVKNKQMERETKKYYRYVGSLTVPPCTENVTWTILGKVREMSLDQLRALRNPLGAGYRRNARPTQALNARQVELHQCLS